MTNMQTAEAKTNLNIVDPKLLVKSEDVADIINNATTVYNGLTPVKLLFDVAGDGKRVLFQTQTEFPRFGLLSYDAVTTEPIMYAVYQIDGNEMPTQVLSVQEVASFTDEDMQQVAGVLVITKDGESTKAVQYISDNGSNQ